MPPATESKRDQIIAELVKRLKKIEEGALYWYTVDASSVHRGDIDWNEIKETESPYITVQALPDVENEASETPGGLDDRTGSARIRGALYSAEIEDPDAADREAERFLADQRRAIFTNPDTGVTSVDMESLILNQLRVISASTVVEQGRAGWKTTEIVVEYDFRITLPGS